MLKTFLPLLFPAALASAKGVTPWSHAPLPDSNAPPLEASVSAWRDGGWVPLRKAAYRYDAEGALVHAEAWNSAPVNGSYQGTWSWDFAYGPDGLVAGIRERTRLDSGWRDTANMPLQVRRVHLTSGGERSDLDLVWHQDRLIVGSRVLMGFNAFGKATFTTRFEFNGTAWRASGHTDFSYDTAGRLVSEGAEGSYRNVHVYDARGLRVSTEWSSWQAGGWRVDASETLEYDSAGRPVSSLVQRRLPGSTGPLAPGERLQHAYPDANTREAAGSTWDGIQWIRRTLDRERLDLRGNVVERITCDPADTGWSETGRSVQEYDARNNLIGSAQYLKDGTRWVLSQSSHSAYDAGNRRISLGLEHYGPGGETSRQEETFRYDARGNLLERTVQRLSPAGDILGGEKQAFAYDPSTSLQPRVRAAGSKGLPRTRRRGGAVFIRDREGNAVRDLQGRAAGAP